MPRSTIGLAVLAMSFGPVAGCSGPPPSAEQKAATNLNPSGRPYVGPRLYQPQLPPNSANAFSPLYCQNQGQGTVCARQAQP